MNNYCTNCGEKITNNDYKCSKCGTPVVDIKGSKEEKEYNEAKDRKRKKTTGTILLIIIVSILVFFLNKIYKYNHYEKYVEKDLEKKYNEQFNGMNLVSEGNCYNCHTLGAVTGAGISCNVRNNCTMYKYELNSSNNKYKYPVYIYIKNKNIAIRDNINDVKTMYNHLEYLEKKYKFKNYNIIQLNTPYDSEWYDYKDDKVYGYNVSEPIIIEANLDNKFENVINSEYLSKLKSDYDDFSIYAILKLKYLDFYSIELDYSDIYLRYKDEEIYKCDYREQKECFSELISKVNYINKVDDFSKSLENKINYKNYNIIASSINSKQGIIIDMEVENKLEDIFNYEYLKNLENIFYEQQKFEFPTRIVVKYLDFYEIEFYKNSVTFFDKKGVDKYHSVKEIYSCYFNTHNEMCYKLMMKHFGFLEKMEYGVGE